ncbi:MAG: tetratricopeptide repeat protein [Terracidiphilus sp.]|nr:tetratricopeptide repeat protein [Terracidiphilus sp.]
MRAAFSTALVLACLVAAGAELGLQAQSNASGSGQNQPAASSENPPAAQTPARTQQQSNQNPFPEDTSNIPVMPTSNSPGTIPGDSDETQTGRIPMPADDADPVRSPEDAGAAAENQQQSSGSSSLAGMSGLLPPADDDVQPGKHHRKGEQTVPEHHETAAEDESVGGYYLDNKDWKAALSRFQSALVLDPDNPDVYWGLAEAERHLGNFADARVNYQKVMDYDPGSRHAKEAHKALQDPAIANAKPPQPAASPQ